MINTLIKIPIFTDIDIPLIQKHIDLNNIYNKQYTKGSTIHNQNDKCITLDIVINGSLVAYALAENGSTINMFEFKKYRIIGANLLFSEINVYPLNIYSETKSEIIHINIDAIKEFLHNYNFTIEFIKSISMNSQGMNSKIAMFTQKTLRENILDYLKQQSLLQKSNTIIIPMTKKQLADFFGVQRASLFREFKNLKDEGIIDINNREIKIFKK